MKEEALVFIIAEGIVEAELFLLEMAECEECKKVIYKRMAIRGYIGSYYNTIRKNGYDDSFAIPFRNYIKERIEDVDIDELMKYMIANDESHWSMFFATTMFTPKKGLQSMAFCYGIAGNDGLTQYVDEVDMDVFSLIVAAFVFDNLCSRTMAISKIVKEEVFNYPTNQYGLTKVNGAIFKRDGLIFDGKGYYYNYFTNKTMLSPLDSMIGFAKIIQGETENCDILYRLDERLSMPECEYVDYTCVSFEKFYGPQFKFDGSNFDTEKTIIVHIDEDTQAKLLMVVKKRTDQNMNTEFWHIEIETLPYFENRVDPVITTFLHGMYYPQSEIFTHIDYTKNQYSADEYQQKYADSIDGMPIDHYTSCRDWHYKIWCIENGEFSKETWYKLMIVSLPRIYQNLLNEILN